MLVDALVHANRTQPRRLAVDDGIRSLDYRRLTLLAAALRDLVRKQTDCPRVGVMLPATAVFPAGLFGVLWANRTIVPLNFLLSPGELGAIVEDAGLDLVITISHFRELAEQLPARILYLDECPLRRMVILRMLRPLPRVPAVDPSDTAVLLYTSGTTALPKGVELTYGNIHSNAVDTILSLDMEPEQVFLNILPPFHVFGLTCNVVIPILLRSTVYAIPRFNPGSVVRWVKEKRVTVLMAIPSMYAAILRVRNAPPDAFSSVKMAVSGGEPLSDSVRKGFEERFGVHLYEGYGMTESSPVIACNRPSENRPGTVGRPVINLECRIVDDEGRDLPDGESGELWVRGPSVMKGYYNRPEETRQAITEDGWLRTGDFARRDPDGVLSITGRLKEMLIIGGENVAPREIEAVLESHPGVQQAAVIGVPDESRGEAAVAFVTAAEGSHVTEMELRTHARKHLAGYKVPKQVIIRDDLPKSPTGKILKRRLHECL